MPTTQYKDGSPSNGSLIRDDMFLEMLLRDIPRKRIITSMGDSKEMRKHMGSTMKISRLIPLLDDRNTAGKGLDNAGNVIDAGQLWGSSTDIDTIKAINIKVNELAIRQNQVSFTRENISASFITNGIFAEQTVDFINKIDSPTIAKEQWMEMITGALEILETNATIRLLEGAGVNLYGGTATSLSTMAATSAVTVKNLHTMSTTLDANRTPRQTDILVGSNNYSTATLANTRVCFIHPDLIYQLSMLKDANDNAAWIPADKFAYSGKFQAMTMKYGNLGVLDGIVGAIGNIMFCSIANFPTWKGKGAAYSANAFKKTGGNLDVYPMMIVGAMSFYNIMWHPDMIDRGLSKVSNLLLGEKKPSIETDDPFSRIHIQSAQWSEGTLITAPERIAVFRTICEV